MGYERKSADAGGEVTPLTKPELDSVLGKHLGEVKSLLNSQESKDEATRRNVEAEFKKFEDKTAEHNLKWIKYETEKKAIEDRAIAAETLASANAKELKDFMVTMATKGGGDGDDGRNAPEYKAFFDLLKTGDKSTFGFRQNQLVEQKMLRTDVGPYGGVLVPPILDSEVRKKITEIDPVRALARVRVLPGKTMSVGVRNVLMDSWYEGEAQPAVETGSQYGLVNVTTFRQTALVRMSMDQLMSAAVNMEAEIASDAGETFAKKEGIMFLKGSGDGQPQGILKDSRIVPTISAASGVISFDDVATLIGNMKSGYMGVLGFNRQTLATLRKLKDTIGNYLWAPAANGAPATIWGEPYVDKFIDMDSASAGSNAVPIVYADWHRGYEIYDTVGMNVIRDDLTSATSAVINYIFRRWSTGKVIMPEAIQYLKIQ